MALAALLAASAIGWSLIGSHEAPRSADRAGTRTVSVATPDGRLAEPPVTADPASCPDRFLGGRAPELVASARDRRVVLCNDAYASLSSALARTPLWAAERLTPADMGIARGTERASQFDADDRLPKRDRAELSDYRRSGWDRGHLAPSADMPGPRAQEQSFLLSNIAPQDAQLNRGDWADLESHVRSLARRRDALYVVTGVLFEDGNLERLPSGRVLIPTSFWKAVASPGEGSAVVVAGNRSGRLVTMKVPEFTTRYGIDPFPAIDPRDRSNLLEIGR
jgi:endonuclease G